MREEDIPQELIDLLLEFATSVLINMPQDVTAYAAQFFFKMNQKKISTINTNYFYRSDKYGVETAVRVRTDGDDSDDSDSELDDDDILNMMRESRRPTVFSEPYDPANEDENDKIPLIVTPKSDAEKERLNNRIKEILLFRNLNKEQMGQILDVMALRHVKPGEIIIKQGDDGDFFYVIDTGEFNIYLDQPDGSKKLIGKLDNSGSFGELALMYNQPRAATIEATTEGDVWTMDRQTFRKIVLKSAYKKRLQYEDFLKHVEILESLEPYERTNLCDALVSKEFNDGDVIIKQGDKADGMYFVEDGEVLIKKMTGGVEIEICRLGNGKYFGELALITNEPRAATVVAVDKIKVAFLDLAAFERIMGSCMSILLRNIKHYEAKMAEIAHNKPVV